MLPLTAPRIPAYAAGYEASRAERLRGLLGRRRSRAGEKDEAAAGAHVAVGGGGGGVTPADRVEETFATGDEATSLDHPATQGTF